MTAAVLTAMAVLAAGLWALALAGANHVRGLPAPGPRPGPLPPAALIVPVTGDAPGVREALASLARQDYPGLVTVFCTATDDDPAVPLAEELIREAPGRVFRVTAGPAVTCGQKNKNLLAGVDFVQGLGRKPDILIFCDSTHLARPDFAAVLAAPLARGEAVLASGFHRVVPLDSAPGTVAMLVICMVLHMMQSIRAVTQPWGGAMAITREAYEAFDVARLWAVSVVDDCSMAAMLRKKGVVCLPVPGAALDTPLGGVGFSRLGGWLTRQLLYLKFCMPGTWLPAVPVALALAALPFAAAVLALGGFLGLAGGLAGLVAAAVLAALAGLGFFLRALAAGPVPAGAFCIGYAAAFPVIGWCMCRTLFTMTMVWRDISYVVDFSGRVRRIIRRG